MQAARIMATPLPHPNPNPNPHPRVQETEMCDWLRNKIEMGRTEPYDAHTKGLLLMELIRGTSFELFLGKRFGTEKRFGVDGCEVRCEAVKHTPTLHNTHTNERVYTHASHTHTHM